MQTYKELTETLGLLLDELEIPHQANMKSLVSASQLWRRDPGQDRWELPALYLSKSSEKRITKLLDEIGLTTVIAPARKKYDYALLLGSTVPDMKQRLDCLEHWWNQGVRFNRLIFLVGQRPLYPNVDNLQSLEGQSDHFTNKKLGSPFTETEAAMMLHQLMPMPASMKAVPVEFIDTPRNWIDGLWHRPNTRDTVKHWLKTSPKQGSAIVISSQPSGLYQQEVVRQELPEFEIDLIANPKKSPTSLSVCLDALALWLYNVNLKLDS